MKQMIQNKVLCRLAAATLLIGCLTVLMVFDTTPARAASGTVYTCTVNRLYQHPVTGVIEDSGGEQSYSIGQGMVEGCVYPTGILEVTDSGDYYLTIRMSLMDYTAGHTFWVQTWGDSGWSTPAAGITGTGTDSNGATADICIQVPNENCIVRGAMYVDPMGRDVYWYMYPSNFSEGNSTDMNATMVTAPSGSSSSGAGSSGSSSTSSDSSGQGGSGSSSGSGSGSQASSGSSLSAGGSLSGGSSLGTGSSSSGSTATVKPSSLGSNSSDASGEGEDTEEGGTENTLGGLNSTIAAPSSEAADPDTESTVGDAQGLSLSTAGEAGDSDNGDGAGSGEKGAIADTAGGRILTNTLSVVIPGSILIAAAAILVYLFRKNWHRWGHSPDDGE